MDLSSPTDEDHAFKMIDFLLEALGTKRSLRITNLAKAVSSSPGIHFTLAGPALLTRPAFFLADSVTSSQFHPLIPGEVQEMVF